MRKRILVVDDDPEIYSLLKKRLEYNGYDCRGASTVEEALMHLQQVKPDLVILDLGFQRVNGTAFLKNAQEWLPPNTKNPPIIVVSGYNQQEIVDYVLEAGAVGFVSKPVDTQVLLSMIHEHIS